MTCLLASFFASADEARPDLPSHIDVYRDRRLDF